MLAPGGDKIKNPRITNNNNHSSNNLNINVNVKNKRVQISMIFCYFSFFINSREHR